MDNLGTIWEEYKKYGVVTTMPSSVEELNALLERVRGEERSAIPDGRHLFESEVVPALVVLDSTIEAANGAACSLYGYAAEELVNQDISLLKDRREPELKQPDSGKLTIPSIHITKSGGEIAVEECYLPLLNAEQHDASRNLLIIHDMSKEIANRTAHREQRKRFESIANILPIGALLVFSEDSKVVFASCNMTSVTDIIPSGDLLGRLALDIFAIEEVEIILAAFDSGQASRHLLRRGEAAFLFHIRPYSFEVNGEEFKEVLVSIQNITETVVNERRLLSANEELGLTVENLHIYQEELKAQNEELTHTQITLEQMRRRYELLFDQAPVCFFLLNASGEVTQANAEYYEIFFSDREKMEKRQHLFSRQIVSTADKQQFREYLHHCFFSGVAAEFQMQCRTSENRDIWAYFSMKKLTDLGGEEQQAVLCTSIDITRQKTAEEILVLRTAALEKTRNELLQQTLFLQTISDTVPVGLFVIEPESETCSWVNSYIANTLKFTPEEWIEALPGAITQEVLKSHQAQAEYVNAAPRPLRREYFIERGNKDRLWMESLWITFRGKTGEKRLQVLGIAVDITERKKLEQQLLRLNEGLERSVFERTQELEASNALMRSVINSSDKVEIFSIDTTFRYTSFNEEHKLLSEAVGGTLPKVGISLESNFTHIPNEVRLGLLTALGGRSTVLNTRRVIDGKTYEYEAVCSPVINDKKEVLGATVFTIDITERRVNEERLRRSEMQLNEAQRIAHLGSWFFFPDETTFIWSDEMFRFAGLEPQTLTPTLDTYVEIIAPEDKEQMKKDLLAVRFPGDYFEKEYRYISKGSRDMRVMLTKGKYYVDPDTMRSGVAGTTIDITELKRLERELRLMNESLEKRVWESTKELQRVNEELRRNADQKSLLLREVHHRLKNNLATVVTVIQVQKRIVRSEKKVVSMLADIESRIKAILHVHQHLHRTDGLDIIDVKPYFSMLVNDIASGFGHDDITISTAIEEAVMNVETAQPCGLIINELLTNAYKYAFDDGKGGTIYLEFRALMPEEVPDDAVEPTIAGKKSPDDDRIFWKVTVSDNGIGLPEGFSLESGKSVGGFIIRSLTNQLGAKLVVESSDKGSSFSFIFTELRYATANM